MRTGSALARPLCAFAVVAALAGCGSGSKKSTTAAPATTSTATVPAAGADLAPYKGTYSATLSRADLHREGAGDLPGGAWTMSIGATDPQTIRLEPGGFDLKAVALANGRITFAPDPTCPTAEGRTRPSVFTIQRTSLGLRFRPVAPTCKQDAAALTLAEWRKI